MEPVSPVRALAPDAGERRPTDDQPRREERAGTFASALAQAVAEEEDR
jgi:hypothetical protein